MSLFTDLIADPARRKFFLLILEPAIDAAGTTTTLYYSEHGFVSAPTDTPANTWFAPRLAEEFGFEFQRSMVNGAQLGGRSVPNWGRLRLVAADGGLAPLLRYGWDGRRIRVLLGGDGFTLADCGLIFDGQGLAISSPDEGRTLEISLRDLSYLFDKPLQTALYTGTGGANGGANLTGRSLPVAYGQVFNAELVVEDRANLKLRYGDGQYQNLTALRDRGSPLTEVGSSPTAGQYTDDTGDARATLGGSPSPSAVITGDIQGDKHAGTYRSTIADIVQEIATSRAARTYPDQFDTAAFAALNTTQPATVGFWGADGAQLQISDVFDRLLAAAPGWWGLTRDNRLTLGRLAAPTGTPVARFGPAEILSLRPIAPGVLPLGKLVVGYQRNWRVQSDSELAGLTWTDGIRDSYMAEYQLTAQATSPAALAKHPQARDEHYDTLLANSADAVALRDHLLSVLGPDQLFFEVVLKAQGLALDLGDEIELTDPDFPVMAAGEDFLIVRMAERLGAGAATVTCVVWRPDV